MRDFCLESQFDIAFYEEEIEAIQESYRKKKLREALYGPLISLLIHIAMLICLFLFGVDRPIHEVKEIRVNIYSQAELYVEPLPVETVEALEEELRDFTTPNLLIDLEDSFQDVEGSFLDSVSDEEPVSNDYVVNDNSLSSIVLSESATFENISGGSEEKQLESSSFLSRRSLRSQRTKVSRISKTIKNGGTRQGQRVLDKSLWWLASVQNNDGSWGKQDVRAMTGLAVLTFLAHGETHHSRHFGGHMKKAFKWLINDKVDRSHGKGYGHAIKTYAICEAYSMTYLNPLEDTMKRCVEALISGQQKNGAFDYQLDPESTRQDTSVTGWCMQALKAAWVTGIAAKGLRVAIDKGLGWLKERSGEKGSFPYSVENGKKNGGNKHSMRAIGALCLQLYGKEKLDELQDEFRILTSEDIEKISWEKPPARSLYAWYYSTQSVFQIGGAAFRKWNAKMEPMLIANQNPKGYWLYPGTKNGSSAMDPLTGKIYSTTLCSLILTVYYRYLPTYKGLTRNRQEIIPNQEELVNVVE